MKEKKNVHRGVAHLPSNERDSNTPVLGVGKLSRIHRTYRKERSSRRSRSRDRFSLFRKALQYFLILIGIAFVAGLSWMIYSQTKNKSIVVDTTTLAEDTFDIPHPHPTECIRIARDFFEISSVQDFEKSVRLVHLKPQEAFQAFEKFRDSQGEIERIDWVGAQEINGLSMEAVMVTYKSGVYRIVYLIPNQSNDWIVDFESILAHNNRSWSQITGEGSCKATVRVIAAPYHYYNGVFADEEEWTCLAMGRPEEEKRIFGYVKNQSSAFEALKEIFKSTNPAPVILEISRDAGMEPLQFEIKKVIAQGWVESDVIFQSRFSEPPPKPVAEENTEPNH